MRSKNGPPKTFEPKTVQDRRGTKAMTKVKPKMHHPEPLALLILRQPLPTVIVTELCASRR